tara:strand:- start:435 stop:665 length:231 start_codon:yes stop_codon:yes gene_type:complete
MYHDDESQNGAANGSRVDNGKMMVVALLMVGLVVLVLQQSYNAVIPNVTKKGSLKLGSISLFQALCLMVVFGILLK